MPKLADFTGAWRLERAIEDAAAGAAELTGRACFRPDGPALVHEEEGVLRVGGASMHATRRYLWSGSRVIDVAFADGRPFHSFDAGGDTAAARHVCGEDLYRVRYDFTAWPRWRAVWTVDGPRKRTRITSTYSSNL